MQLLVHVRIRRSSVWLAGLYLKSVCWRVRITGKAPDVARCCDRVFRILGRGIKLKVV